MAKIKPAMHLRQKVILRKRSLPKLLCVTFNVKNRLIFYEYTLYFASFCKIICNHEKINSQFTSLCLTTKKGVWTDKISKEKLFSLCNKTFSLYPGPTANYKVRGLRWWVKCWGGIHRRNRKPFLSRNVCISATII